MLRPEGIALELFEYKVGDLVSRSEPTGGRESVAALHDYLTHLEPMLSAEARRRFAAASQEFRRLSAPSSGLARGLESMLELAAADLSAGDFASVEGDAASSTLVFDQLELSTSLAVEAAKQVLTSEATILLSPAEREEQRILKRLAERVQQYALERTLKRLAAAYRAERERYTVRLVYGVLRNLTRYAQRATFSQDATLVHFEVEEAVLERSDPLYSFNDLESVTELLRELVEVALNFKGPKSPYRTLELDENRVLAYLRRFALAVARDPYAGRLSSLPNQDMNAQQLRQMIQALGREPLSEAERSAQQSVLEARLHAAWERERSQRALFEHDVEAFTQAAEALFTQLGQHLPKRVGGEAEEPRLTGGVLFAENSALNLTEIPRRVTALTLQLKGPTRLSLAGVNIAVIGAAGAWRLGVANEQAPLTETAVFESADRRVVAFLEEGYLHLEVRDDARTLSELLAEALAVHVTLRSGFLDLLRTAVGVLPGEPQEVARQAITQLRRLVASAPDKRRVLEGLCWSAAKASGVTFTGSTKEVFLRHLHLAVSTPDDDLLGSLKGARYQLLDEPLNIRVAGQPLTVRRYYERAADARESAVVVRPDAPLGALSDYALFDFAGGTLLCALSAGEFAAVYLQGDAAQTVC